MRSALGTNSNKKSPHSDFVIESIIKVKGTYCTLQLYGSLRISLETRKLNYKGDRTKSFVFCQRDI